ncbi:30S ribosomal protein S6--L-glutamate ligase [Marinicauda salina]|uniref:Probable alpha-L-glutamate ligase n=1 Tax=Marinicauda salina TaxID=2135793 RepID=A0A2U2BUM4_9PROT|nr:30S ribosomal protein S6--L-glutamate ligase [Marinicauda salina]PWE17736.1 30S ribosomal protein S6--L-glutamate ligase [Marinicauda salina]
MSDPFVLGWEEWAAFPGLGLPAIKAKVDTGARTSALHAVSIEPFGREDAPQVRFVMHPIPDQPEVEVVCAAPAVDRREVTSSNGETELRWVIEARVKIGEREWPIEVTLTNRETMQYRMLLGRTAILDDMVVSPTTSCAQGELSWDLYKDFPRKAQVKRPLRIAILTREPNNYSSQRLREAAEARGHVAEMINTARCTMAINALSPAVYYDGRKLPRYDAVIPRIGASMTNYGMAVLRQFAMTGAYILNSAESIGVSRDKLYAHQVLARAGIGMPTTAFAHSPKDTKNLIEHVGGAPLVVKLLESTQGRGVVLAETRKAAESVIDAFRGLDANFIVQEFVKEAGGADIRCFLVGGKVVASMMRQAAADEFRSNLHRGGEAVKVRITKEERAAAVKAAKVMGLGVAGVDLLRSESGPKVIEVNSSPGIEGIERSSGKDVAGLMIEHVENHVRTVTRPRARRGAAAKKAG